MESATIAAQGTPRGAKEGDKGLKAGAIGYLSNLVAAHCCINRADPGCGTSFTWVTTATRRGLGRLTGRAIGTGEVVGMAALACIAGVYTFLLFGLDAAAANLLDVSIVASICIIVMSWICYTPILVNRP